MGKMKCVFCDLPHPDCLILVKTKSVSPTHILALRQGMKTRRRDRWGPSEKHLHGTLQVLIWEIPVLAIIPRQVYWGRMCADGWKGSRSSVSPLLRGRAEKTYLPIWPSVTLAFLSSTPVERFNTNHDMGQDRKVSNSHENGDEVSVFPKTGAFIITAGPARSLRGWRKGWWPSPFYTEDTEAQGMPVPPPEVPRPARGKIGTAWF